MANLIHTRLKHSAFAGAAAVLFLGAAQLGAPTLAFVGSAQALSQDVTLENIVVKKDKNTVTIKSAVFQGTNLGKDELTKLLSGSATSDETKALIAKLSASKISIPEITGSADDKNRASFRDFVATDVNAGKAGSLSLGSADISGMTDKGEPFNIKAGTLTLKDADFGPTLRAISTGDIEKGMFKYSKFDWAGLDATFPEPEAPATLPGGNLIKVKIGAMTGAASFDGDIFRKTSGGMKSGVIEFPKGSKTGQALAAFGYDKIDIGFSLDGDYDPATKKANLGDYTISGVNAGAIGLKAQFGGLDKAAFAGDPKQRAAALAAGDISGFTLRYANTGLFEKAVAFLAAQDKKKPDALKAEWTGMAQGIIPAVMGADPAGKKLADAIAAFIANPKSLTISAKAKAGAISFKDLMLVKNPMELLPKIDLSAVANQ